MPKIGPTTLSQIRLLYKETWKTEWPHSNKYLQTLIFEEEKSLGFAPNDKVRDSHHRKAKTSLFKEVLSAMRSDDTTPILYI